MPRSGRSGQPPKPFTDAGLQSFLDLVAAPIPFNNGILMSAIVRSGLWRSALPPGPARPATVMRCQVTILTYRLAARCGY